MADKPAEAPYVNVQSSSLGVRLTCSKWGCRYDEYVGQSIPLPRLVTLASEHVEDAHGGD